MQMMEVADRNSVPPGAVQSEDAVFVFASFVGRAGNGSSFCPFFFFFFFFNHSIPQQNYVQTDFSLALKGFQ